MSRKVMALVVGLIAGLSLSTYFGYIEASLRAATKLRAAKDYAASASKLEAVLPYMWIDHYRSQALLKLAFNYRDLARYERLNEVAQQLEADYPRTIYRYYGVKLQADSLVAQGDYPKAINLYSTLLATVTPKKSQETLHGLREEVMYELAVTYRHIDDEQMFLKMVERLKMEYPASPYIATALHRK